MSIPAVAGAGQVVQRPGERDLDDASGPIELMVDATQRAAADTGSASILGQVQWVGVAGGWFRYRNPGALVAERIGAPDAATALTEVSGTSPQDLVALAAERIAAGDLDVALVVGGEARWSRQRLSRAGRNPKWCQDPGEGEPERIAAFPAEFMDEASRLGALVNAYALMEDSLRVEQGATMDTQRDLIARLWSEFSDVATANPFAWDREPHSAEEIRDPSRSNRMIASPYTKAMVANNTVDMASALILCSVETADRYGISRSQLVYPHVITTAHETWRLANRESLHAATALTTAGRVAMDRAGIRWEDITYIDLYACFPSIVQMSVAALGVPPGRVLTVTGGLGFGGGAVGNATGHALATMIPLLRGGGRGLVHGNGGNATKHSFGIYGSDPPDRFETINCQDQVPAGGRAELASDWSGPVTVEAATVVFGRAGPDHVLAAVLSSDGSRGWATSSDPAAIETGLKLGLAGAGASRLADGLLSL